jgi:hypothetical protein
MTEIENRLKMKVSYQKTAFADLSFDMTLDDVLTSIKNENYKRIISELRIMLSLGEVDSYNNHKRKLPGVTFSGTFIKNRKGENLQQYNSVIVLDIDKLSEDELLIFKNNLQEDEFVFAFWESPSQKGLKGLVFISFDIEINDIFLFHKIAFKKLVEYFFEKYSIKLDESGSDISRLCFLSSDPNILIKKQSSIFTISQQDVDTHLESIKKSPWKASVKDRVVTSKYLYYNAEGKNSPLNRYTIKSITKFLSKRNFSITNSYENWYRIAFAVANSFTLDVGEKYFLRLCQQDKEKYNEVECKNLLINCYETTKLEINFSTILFFAQQIGYKSNN